MQPIPLTLPFSAVDTSSRIRQTYNGIEDLADGISQLGLIQPIIIRWDDALARWTLVDGGRRYRALEFLQTETLYYGATTTQNRPGFVVAEEETHDPLINLLRELAANHDREDIPWQEELPAIVSAWRLIQQQHHARGEEITMRAFGYMLGVSYHELQAANSIWEEFQINPKRFENCTNVRAALSLCLKAAADQAAVVHAQRSSTIATTMPLPRGTAPQPFLPPILDNTVPDIGEVRPDDAAPDVAVPLSRMFHCCDSLEYMASLPKGCINHIVTDPDYALSVEALSSAGVDAERGVRQENVTKSLADLFRFIELAHAVTDDNGFCAYFMDLEHWEKLRDHSGAVGWCVQRWPLIWRKTDYRSNSAPRYNFCKNMEYAMVLRKPGAVLQDVQTSSVFEWPSGPTIRKFNHPFAKPHQVWWWIMRAVAARGQTIYDPFLGSASGGAAAVTSGFAPLGSELDPNLHANAMVNMQLCYKEKMGPNTKFC